MEKSKWILKNLKLLFLLSTVLPVMISCQDDGNDAGWINPENNKMFAIMQTMMKSLDSLKMTSDPDNDFAMMMREHHKSAINMGNLELKEGKDSDLQEFARRMISKQQKEIVTLDSFLVVHAKADDNQSFSHMARSAMDKMMNNARLQNINGDMDNDFARLMIQHHQGGIDMAELQINMGHSDGLKAESKKTKDDQQKDIKILQDWLLKK